MEKSFKSKLLLGVAAFSSLFFIHGSGQADTSVTAQNKGLCIEDNASQRPIKSTRVLTPSSFSESIGFDSPEEDLVNVLFSRTLYDQAMHTNPLVMENGRANPIHGSLMDQGLLKLIDLGYETSKVYGFNQKIASASPTQSSERKELEAIKKKRASAQNRVQDLSAHLIAKGWTVLPFYGQTGYAVEGTHGSQGALCGIVAARNGRIVVIPTGSICSEDWQVNFDGQVVHAHEVGLTIDGDPLIHRGFGHRVASFKDDLLRVVDELRPVAGPDMNLIISGHSQGGGTGAVLSMLMASDWAKNTWGPLYSNVAENRIKTILFSAPRAVGVDSLPQFDALVGKNNAIRQNVHGDPVPVAQDKDASPFKDVVWEVVSKVPYFSQRIKDFPQFHAVIKEGSLDPVTGLAGVGTLASDSFLDAFFRAANMKDFKGLGAPAHYGQTFSEPDGSTRTSFSPAAVGKEDNIDDLLRNGSDTRPFYEGGITGAFGNVASALFGTVAAVGTATLHVSLGVGEASVPVIQGFKAGLEGAYNHLLDGYNQTAKEDTAFKRAGILVPAVAKAVATATWETTKGAAKGSVPLLKRVAIGAKEMLKSTPGVVKKLMKATAQSFTSVGRCLKRFGSWLSDKFA